MLGLPIIVAAGGINSAGRSSHRHNFKRLVVDGLSARQRDLTHSSLAQLMENADRQEQLNGTLIRGIESSHFDPAAVPFARRVTLGGDATGTVSATQYVDGINPQHRPVQGDGRRVQIAINTDTEILLPGSRSFEVSVAGQLPTGFDPGAIYPSRNHPRGLQMSVFAASDALADLGIDWSDVMHRVAPDAVSVYMSSSMGQLDDAGTGGMLQARALGKKATSKQCPLGFAEMPGDFLNAYVLRSMGQTGPAVGACATFLYNLQRGVHDIRSGRARVAIIGAAEAPILPEIMEGYIAMGALATDKALRQLDGLSSEQAIDARRACRPFGENCGFTMAESAQTVVLMDDALALELGAPILAAVPDVFVHADGAKKSITGPGAGNFITVARAAAAAQAIVGEQRMRAGGMIQAHGTGTPQNRVTESEIFSRVAQAFGVDQWSVVAIKSHIGHSLGAAAGDQLSAALGIWETGLLPAINTIDGIADDVSSERLKFVLETTAADAPDYSLVNSKGFGGNNATAVLLSPSSTLELLNAHHGNTAMIKWRGSAESVQCERQAIESERLAGSWVPTYVFNEGVVEPDAVSLTEKTLTLGEQTIDLATQMPQGWSLN